MPRNQIITALAALLLPAAVWVLIPHPHSQRVAVPSVAPVVTPSVNPVRASLPKRFGPPSLRAFRAKSYTVKGGGNSAANGIYTPDTTTNGAVDYSNGAPYCHFYYDGQGNWVLGGILGERYNPGSSTCFYHVPGTAGAVPSGVLISENGYDPAPIITVIGPNRRPGRTGALLKESR